MRVVLILLTAIVTLKSERLSLLMPQVLKKILRGHTREETQAVTQVTDQANNGSQILAAGMDLEQAGISQDNGQENSSTSHQQRREQHQGIIYLQEALIYLCWAIRATWIDRDQDLTRKFNEIVANICSERGIPCKTLGSLWEE